MSHLDKRLANPFHFTVLEMEDKANYTDHKHLLFQLQEFTR